MKDIDEINKDLMFNQIYNILKKEYGQMPIKGVIAGQAVASAIFKMLSITKSPPFNDLDIFTDYNEYPVFYDKDDERGKRSSSMGLGKASGSSSTRFMGSGSFDVDIGSIDQTSYRIFDCDYDPSFPRLNYVRVGIEKAGLSFNKHADVVNLEGMERAQTIIKSFDINCCQAAIDLNDKTVHWTRGFKDFLYQKELKVKYFGTPMHTAIRLLKKNDELDFATLNMDEEMLKLQTSRAIFSEIEEAKEKERQFIPGNIFSPIYKRRYMDRSDILNKYFRIEQRIISWEDVKKTFYVLEPESYNEETLMLFRKIYSRCGQEVDGKEVELPKLENIIVDKIIGDFESIYEQANSNSKKAKKVNDFIDYSRANYLTREFRSLDVHRFLSTNAILDKEFSYSGYTDSIYEMISKFYKSHPFAVANLSRYPIETQVKCIQNLRWAENNGYSFIIGLIENDGVYAESDKVINAYIDASKNHNNESYYLSKAERFKSLKGVDQEDAISIEVLSSKRFKDKAKHMLTLKKERMSKNASYPILDEEIAIVSEKAKFNVKIKELNNEFLLYMEGEEMKHCVGGYWRNVEQGRSYIFGIMVEGEDGIERSTLEIKYSHGSVKESLDDLDFSNAINFEDLPVNQNVMVSDSGFSISQHRGKQNEMISEESKQVGHAILKIMASKRLDMYTKYRDLEMIDEKNDIVIYDKAVEYLKENEVSGFEQLYIRNFTRCDLLEVPNGFTRKGAGIEENRPGFPQFHQQVEEQDDGMDLN